MSLAEQALMRALRRRVSRSVVIKDAEGWAALYGELQQAMTNAWNEAMREGIAAALDRLRDLGPGRFTEEDGAAILRVLEGSVGVEAIRAAMREPVVNLSDALFRLGAAEVGAATGVAIAFMRPDLDALDALKQANLYWIGESWNSHSRKKIEAVLHEYFTEGLTREGLAARLAEEFASVTGRSEVYWEMVADHMATKTREIGRITGYERAGIAYVQVRAHLDERTTRICRAMHGRIISVSKMRAQAEAYIKAANRGDKPAMEAAWTMHGAKADLSATPTHALRGTASPPYHYRCRTSTVAWFGEGESELDRWRRAAYDREPLSRKDVGALIERAKSANWPHAKVAESHFRRKAGELGLPFQDEYNQSAIDLIRRGDRDVYISTRKGVLNATFVRPFTEQRKQRPGFLVTSVDIEANKITSHHWRENLETTGDEVPAQRQPGRGIMKWLIG